MYCLSAVSLLLAAPAFCAGPFFNILDYGARNDGSAPATEAFRAAIQAAKAAGGGTVYVPAGKYVTGPIELVSNLVAVFRRRRHRAIPGAETSLHARPAAEHRSADAGPADRRTQSRERHHRRPRRADERQRRVDEADAAAERARAPIRAAPTGPTGSTCCSRSK